MQIINNTYFEDWIDQKWTNNFVFYIYVTKNSKKGCQAIPSNLIKNATQKHIYSFFNIQYPPFHKTGSMR